MRKILGIDPGITGGISIIDEQSNLICSFRMPIKKIDGKNKVDSSAIHQELKDHDISLAIIEKVGARPGQGVVSMFSFGDAYGSVRAIAEILSDNVHYITPQKWRSGQGLSKLSKEQIAAIAFKHFNDQNIYGRKNSKTGKHAIRDGISDSLMIAKYGLRLLK